MDGHREEISSQVRLGERRRRDGRRKRRGRLRPLISQHGPRTGDRELVQAGGGIGGGMEGGERGDRREGEAGEREEG